MLSAAHVELEIRQQPQRAQVVQASNQKNRKPIDPPPIVELRINDVGDPYSRYWHVSPRTFMIVTLLDAKEDSDGPLEDFGKHLIGQTVSSLHRLRDGPSHGESDQDNFAAFFVFGDVSAKKMGEWRLRFSLFDTIRDSDEIVFLRSIDSEPFRVMAQKDFMAMAESTSITRQFADQGVKLRVRKLNQSATGKRAYNSNNSPPVISPTLSPTHPHPGMMGGPVQSRQGYRSDLVHSNTPKRLRMSSEYDNSQYGMPNLNASGNIYPYSSMSLPSRAWSNGQQSRGHISYAPQATSNLPSTTFAAMPALSSGSVWPSHHSSTSFPSPPPSSNHSHYPSFQYPSSSGYPSNAGMLGPLSPRQLNTPAGYYDSYTTHQAHHGHQDSSTSNSAIRDLFPDQTAASDGAGLASPQSQGYNQPYLPGSGHYGSGVNDGTFPPAFGDGVDGQHRYQ